VSRCFPQGLRQQPIQPLFLIRTKLHNANHHAKLPGGWLRAIGAEQPIPAGKAKAEIAIGFLT
jgi:hypothetical protein